jgi:hypothetical protein
MKKFEFDELIEKAFSMGYEYALEEIEEQREFSEKEEKEEKDSKKMSLGDRMDVWAYKNLYGKKYRKGSIEGLDDKESLGKAILRETKTGAKIGVTGGALLGALAGAVDKDGGDSAKERALNALKFSGIGAAAGAGYGAAVGTIKGGTTIPLRRIARKDPKVDSAIKREQDKMRVADGQMTKEEFLEKWG